MTENTTQTEYQVGAHDINENTMLEGSESIKFDFENAAIFKRLADDIYESPEAGIREPLQNSLTAIKRAIEDGSIEPSEGVVEIEVTDGEQVGLVLHDNGIGISKNVLDEVLTVIGRSQNRDNGTVSGKYGMGFLACYKLVGVDGGFVMYTNSRYNSNPPLAGVWKPGMFELDRENKLPQRLSSNDYGTRFEFTLHKDITINDVRDWVEKHAKWATIPIIYREFDSDNCLSYDDEFGIKKLTDEHKDVGFNVQIDNDYFTAICSPNQKGRTLLINSPIERNSSYNPDNVSLYSTTNPANMDIKLKNENGIVVKGPHKGLMPVSEAEYNSMPDERKSKYISEDKLNKPTYVDNVMDDNIDITIPKPTGTRDTLERNSYFWSYLHKKMVIRGKNKITSCLSDVNKPSEFFNLSKKEQEYVISAIPTLDIDNSLRDALKSDFKYELSLDISDDLAEFYLNLYESVYHITRNSTAAEASKKHGTGVVKQNVGQIIKNLDNSGQVFMGVFMNQTKMNAVWEDNENNIIIRVNKSKFYEKYDRLYGWNQLKYVKEHININSLSETTKSSLTNKSSKKSSSVKNKEIKNRTINIHCKNDSANKNLKDIKSKYSKEESEKLILFLSNSDKNLSDYYDIVTDDVSISNALVKMWDYLKSAQNITTIENWIKNVNNMTFKTSDGIYTAENLSKQSKNIVFHVTNDTKLFQHEHILEQMKYITNNQHVQDSADYENTPELLNNSIIYVPISHTKLNYLKILFDDIESNNIFTINSNDNLILGNYINVSHSDLYWYAWSCLPSWRKTNQIKMLMSPNYTITDEWVELINKISNENYELNNWDFPNLSETQYKTSEGLKSVSEIQDEYDLMIIHVLQNKIAKLFQQENVISKLKEYVYENESPVNYGFSTKSANEMIKETHSFDNVIYIPVTVGEQKDLKEIYDDDMIKMHNVSERGLITNRNSEIDNDTSAYAYALLPPEVYSTIIPSNRSKMKDLSNGGLEFVNTMYQQI